ncbi:hypothetical protein SGCOL_007650 [Colletotrichum sp. CLE4]
MAEVYRNGVINIAATAASGGDEGLYFDHDPCGMDYRIGQFAYSNDRIGSFGKAYTNRDPRAFSQVLWRLKSMAKEEKDPFMLEEAYLPWEEVVTTYTAQYLTKGEDKLIAVQALAKAMEEAVDDCYVAGLWESRLVEDLLWACSAPGEKARYSRQITWRAPTWSWASIDGGSVKKATLTGRYAGRKAFDGEALVRNVKYCVEGYDRVTTGQLKSARLQLEGYLLESTVSWEGEALSNDGHVKGIGLRCLDSRIRTFIVCPDEWSWDGIGKANYRLLMEQTQSRASKV